MAALSTFDDLKTALGGWVHRADVTGTAVGVGVDDVVETWILLFEAYANRALREWDTEKVANLAVASEYVTAPSDLLELKTAVLTDGTTRWGLEPAPQWVIDRAVVNPSTVLSRPEFFALVARQFRFYPAPDKSYTAILTYFASLAALSLTNPTNWLLDLAPDAYLYGSLVAAAPYLRDTSSLPIWKGLRDEALASVIASQRQPSARLRSEFASSVAGSRWNIYSDT